MASCCSNWSADAPSPEASALAICSFKNNSFSAILDWATASTSAMRSYCLGVRVAEGDLLSSRSMASSYALFMGKYVKNCGA